MIADKAIIHMTTEAKGLEARAMEDDKAGRSLVPTGWEKVALNALTIPLLGAAVDVSDVSRKHEVPIKDDWLGAVAGLPAVSKRGLRHLSDALSEKGMGVRQGSDPLREDRGDGPGVGQGGCGDASSTGRTGTFRSDQSHIRGCHGVVQGRDLLALFTKEAAVLTGRTASAAAAWLRKRNQGETGAFQAARSEASPSVTNQVPAREGSASATHLS